MQKLTVNPARWPKRVCALVLNKFRSYRLIWSDQASRPAYGDVAHKNHGNRLPYLSGLMLMIAGTVFAQADLVVTPAVVTNNSTDTFIVTVSLETANNQLVDAVELYLNFDPAIINAVSVNVSSGNPLNIPLPLIAIDNTNGIIAYGAGTFDFANLPVADFNLVDIVFQPLTTGSTNLNFLDPPGVPSLLVTLIGDNVLGAATGASITIQDEDLTPPVITLMGSNPLELTVGDTYVEPGATALDDTDGDISFAVISNSSSLDTNTPGQYFVSYNVSDSAGNPALEVLRTVNVNPIVISSFTLIASPGANGTISPLSATVNAGDNQTFDIIPDPGYEVADVTVNSVSQGPLTSYQFINVQADATISATFSELAPFQVCIGSGNTALTALGRSFLADPSTAPPVNPLFSRTNGKAYLGYNGPIAGTIPGSAEELLFQEEIYGGNTGAAGLDPSFVYNVDVSNGYYQVDLYFSEVFHPGPGGRVFDVLLEGSVILDEYDLVNPLKDGLSTNQTAITRTYYVAVTDGTLNVQIGPASIDNGKLSGLCVTATSNTNVHPVANIGDLTFDALVPVAQVLNITDTDLLAISFNGMPASLTYNPTSNQLEGTPLATDAGTYTVNAIISDGNSAPVTEEFTVVINPPAGDDPPSIPAISDIIVAEGGTAATPITVTDDNNVYNTDFVLYDKSNGGTNNPITPQDVVPDTDYSFTDNGSGSYSFSWTTGTGDGRSYLARVTTNDGINPAVSLDFNIHVALPLIGTSQARTFSNPLPWYNTAPVAPFTIIIEGNTNQNIGYIDNGEFVEYVVNVPAAGEYIFTIMAAKDPAGPTPITLSEINGGINIPVTVNAVNNGGGWQDYAAYATNVVFNAAGLQTIRLSFAGPVNVQEFNFTPPADTSPTIDPIADVQVDEGGTVSVNVQVTDDFNPSATIILYDKSVPGGTNSPFTPAGIVSGYSFTDNGSGSYDLVWNTTSTDGRSYEARVTANDGANPPITEVFTIDVAQDIPGVILARTFNNPLPWYGPNPALPFTISIEPAGNIGYVNPGDFTEYLIDVPTAGTYSIRVNASKGSGDSGLLTLSEEDGSGFNPLGTITVNQTGWGSYEDYTTDLSFTNPGLQTLRFDFSGGMNITEFELLDPNANTPPVVTITAPLNGSAAEQGLPVTFTGTALDDEDGDIGTNLVWTSNIDGAFGIGASFNFNALSQGTHTITATATDNDLADPLNASAAVIVYIGTPAPDCDVAFRVNAGGPLYISATGNFEADQATVNAGGTAVTGSPSAYVNTTLPAQDNTFGSTAPLVSNTTGYPDFLFQTERWSEADVPNNMKWAFPTGNGIFTVDILFNENWTGEAAEPRVFDMEIEGVIELNDYRPSGDGSELNVAKVESFQVEVTDGVLNIDFIKGTQNPSVKGFSICTAPDNTAPVITLLGDNPLELIVGGSYSDPGATASDDTDGDISANIVIGGDVVDPNTVGVYLVTYDVMDSANNAAIQVIRTVNVVPVPDATAPVITLLGDNPLELIVGGSYSDPGATASDDTDGDISANIVVGGDVVDPNTVGVYLVTYDVMDSANNPAIQVIRTVNVVPVPDATAPVITLLGDNPLELIVGGSYSDPGATASDDTDGDISANIVVGGDVVDPNTVGVYLVTYDVMDSANNPAIQVIRTVNVVPVPDATAPVITLLGDNPLELIVGGSYSDPGATASDDTDGDISANIVIGGDVVDPNTVGVYLVTYDVMDSANNPAIQVIRTVNVVPVPDATAPVITLLGDNPLELIVGGSYSDPGATASDDTDGDISANIVIGGDVVDPNTVGVYLVTYDVMDSANNPAIQVIRTVNVVLPQPLPSLTITPAFISVNLPQGGTTDVNYIVDSDDGSTLPTPAAMTLTDDDTGIAPTWAATTSAANQGTAYEVSFNTTGLTPGTYSALLTAGPVTGYNDTSIPITLVVQPISTVLSVTSFTLVDANTDQDIRTILDGDLIDITTLPTTNLNIRANTTPDVVSISLQLTGALSRNQTENVAPYALYGDTAGNYAGITFVIGNYNLNGIPYSGTNLGGSVGTPLALSFELTDQDPECIGFDVSITAVANPTSCTGNNGTATASVQGGTGPYTYLWDNGNTNATANNLGAGQHSVLVTDINGCAVTELVTLDSPPLPAVTLGAFPAVLITDVAFSLSGGSPAGGTYSGTGVSSGVFNPSSAGIGTHLITYSYTDPATGCSNTASQNITVNAVAGNAALTVLNADTDTALFDLTDGLQIDKGVIGNTLLGVIYNPDLNPGNVRFILSGPINTTRNEGVNPPYSLFGDIGNNVLGMVFPVGNYTLSANPQFGPTIVVNFSVVDGPPVNQPPIVVANGTPDGSIPFHINFSSAGSSDSDGILSYNWMFGDGASSSLANPSHTYATGGSKSVTLTITDNLGLPASTNITVQASDPGDIDEVVSFTLINAITDNDLYELTNGLTINGSGINIRANTDPGLVGSVQFVLTGPLNRNLTETTAPYALFGDDPASGNYNSRNLPNGSYTLTATPYSLAGGNGVAGQILTINFNVGTVIPLFAKAAVSPLMIHPNPADREATLDFADPVKMEDIFIYDMTGRLVKSIKVDSETDVQTYLLRVQDLPDATYIVRLRDASGYELQQRMVIKRQ